MITMGTDVGVVAAQLAAFSMLVFTGDLIAVISGPPLMAVFGVGLLLMVVSQVQLGRSYSFLSRPRSANVLRRRGVYRHLRHPIYTGLLIVTFAFFLSRPGIVTGIAYLLLVLVTNVRAGIEERMLGERHPEYEEYRRRTKRFIPFVY